MINSNKWKWLRIFVTLNKDEDAYCDFIYNQDMKKQRINLTDHYNDYMYDMNEKMGIQINETFIMNYSPEHSDEIYEIMTKLIDLFINSSEYDDPQIYRQKYLFKKCRSNKLLIESINLLSVAYLDWLMFEIENNKKLKNEKIPFTGQGWDNTTFIDIVESTYRRKNIENAIWNECNYKKSNELIEYEFYNGSVINLLKDSISICKDISMLLAYLYKYHKKVQHFYTEFNGHNFDEFSDSIVQSFRKNNLSFENTNFDIIYMTLCNN